MASIKYPFDLGVSDKPAWEDVQKRTGPRSAATWFSARASVGICISSRRGKAMALKNAAAVDTTFALAYWGISVAIRPTITCIRITDIMSSLLQRKERFLPGTAGARVVEQAERCSMGSSDLTQSLVHAQKLRCMWPLPEKEGALRVLSSYADAMKLIASKYSDPDVIFFYAESLMQLEPWKLVCRDVDTMTEIAQNVADILSSGLSSCQDHPGLCHLAIHLYEMSPSKLRMALLSRCASIESNRCRPPSSCLVI